MEESKEQLRVYKALLSKVNYPIREEYYLNYPLEGNSQDYTEENCHRVSIPYFSNFVDIDTHLIENKKKDILIIRGYYAIKDITNISYTDMLFVNFLLKNKTSNWIVTTDPCKGFLVRVLYYKKQSLINN